MSGCVGGGSAAAGVDDLAGGRGYAAAAGTPDVESEGVVAEGRTGVVATEGAGVVADSVVAAAGCGTGCGTGMAITTVGTASGSGGKVFTGGLGREVIGCTESFCWGTRCCVSVSCCAGAFCEVVSVTLLSPGGLGRDVMGCAVCACVATEDTVHTAAQSKARLVNIAFRRRCMSSLNAACGQKNLVLPQLGPEDSNVNV